MAKRCQLTGKAPMFGHNVSHSKRRTNRRFDPNLQKATFVSDALRSKVSLRVSTRVLRTVSLKGGLDAFLLGTADAKLAEDGLRLKRRVKKALAGSSAKSSRPAMATSTA
jgi:large subunit ribosomal protein L28